MRLAQMHNIVSFQKFSIPYHRGNLSKTSMHLRISFLVFFIFYLSPPPPGISLWYQLTSLDPLKLSRTDSPQLRIGSVMPGATTEYHYMLTYVLICNNLLSDDSHSNLVIALVLCLLNIWMGPDRFFCILIQSASKSRWHFLHCWLVSS